MPLQLQSSDDKRRALEGKRATERERKGAGKREESEAKFWCVAFFKFPCKHAINMYADERVCVCVCMQKCVCLSVLDQLETGSL